MTRSISCCLVLFLSAASAFAENAVPVSVTLRRESNVNVRVATTNDIANVVGGDAVTRRQIKQLDIAVGNASQPTKVTKSQLMLRFRLAGIPADKFRISGSDSTLIRWLDPAAQNPSRPTYRSADIQIVDVAKTSLAELWKVPLEDVEVRLTRPLPAQVRDLFNREDDIAIKPFLSGSEKPGSLRFSFGAYQSGELTRRSIAVIEARLFRQVAVAAKEIKARELITTENSIIERQPTVGRVATHAASGIVGKTATHSIRKGDVFLVSDVGENVSSDRRRQTVIRRGDLVRLVAIKNGLNVSVQNCEALENGHEGETIRIRNPNSKKTVAGRVVRAGHVEVAL